MQRWENVDPAELARRAARRQPERGPLSAFRGLLIGLGFSCLFWTALVAAYVIGQR